MVTMAVLSECYVRSAVHSAERKCTEEEQNGLPYMINCISIVLNGRNHRGTLRISPERSESAKRMHWQGCSLRGGLRGGLNFVRATLHLTA